MLSHNCYSDVSHFHLRIALDGVEQKLKVRKIIRHSVRKLNHIVFNSEIILKSQSLVALAVIILIAEVILLIVNVVSFPPPGSLHVLIALLRPDYRFHSDIVQRFRLVLH